MIIFLNVVPSRMASPTNWTLFVVWLMLGGIIKEARQKVLLTDDRLISRYDFPGKTKIEWSAIGTVTTNANMVTIQAINKDFISIDLDKSTERERKNVEILIKNNEHKLRAATL